LATLQCAFILSILLDISAYRIMAAFRSKKLDLGCFITIRNIRDHTKRKVFEEHEPERYEQAARLRRWPEVITRLKD
jgi:hypothetical protein